MRRTLPAVTSARQPGRALRETAGHEVGHPLSYRDLITTALVAHLPGDRRGFA
jgi:hypothetical protein